MPARLVTVPAEAHNDASERVERLENTGVHPQGCIDVEDLI